MTDIADETPSTETEQPPLRSQAVDRSLDGARARAEERVQRFLDAATELIIENGGLDFTVQDVVERSTQSLRSFYQFFDGKQHLLLAVYEDAMAATAAELAVMVDTVDDPLEKLHATLVTLYEWSELANESATPAPQLTVRSMASFVFDLMTTDRNAVMAATAPLFSVVLNVLHEAVASDAVKVDNERATGAFLLQTVLFNAFGSAGDGDDAARRERAESLWQFLLHGIAER